MDDFKVFPSEAFAAQTIQLSMCDVYSPKVWVPQTHFWPLEERAISVERTFDILKQGLSRTIAEVPALAGHIRRGSQDPRDLHVRIESNAHVNLGYEDLSRSLDIPNYAVLRAGCFPMTGLKIALSPTTSLTPVSEGAPMLVVKLVRLAGGISLTFALNHLLADATTVAEVERIWSLHTGDVSCGRRQKYKPALPDVDIRRQLSTPVPGAVEFHDEHWQMFPTERSQLNLPRQAVSAEAALTMLHEAAKAKQANSSGTLKEVKWCMWHFTPACLQALKKDTLGPDSTEWISTMDALIGLFWSRIAIAKQKGSEGHTSSLACFPINIRQRLQPPIDMQYIGNAVDIVMSQIDIEALEHESKGVANAAQSIRRAIRGWNQQHWEAWLSTACQLPNDQAICPNPLSLLEEQNIGFNDYSRSQSNMLSWGELGQIECTRYSRPASSLNGCATTIFVHPRLADGGLEVATSTDDDVRALLEKDAVFQRYARLKCVFA